MHLDRRLVGWGFFFIILGGVPLAVRAGLISADVAGRWLLLWPLLLIGWGLGLLLRRTPIDWLGGAVTVLTLGLMGGGLIATGFGGIPGGALTGCGSSDAGSAFPPQKGTLGSAAKVTIEFNCGTLDVGTGDGFDWQVSGTDADARGPDIQRATDAVTLRSAGAPDNIFRFDSTRVGWDLTVPREPLLDLGLTLNAGQGNVDLGGARLGSLNLTVNAGTLHIALEEAASLDRVNATLNAGTATLRLPEIDGEADVSLNAGSLTTCVPDGAALRVHWSGALAANDLDESGLVKVDESTWASAGFDAGRPHLELRVSANAGRFDLEIGGSCSA